MTQQWYSVYGLTIESEVPLAVPPSSPAAPDVVVRRGSVDAEPPFIAGSRSFTRATPHEVCGLWDPMGKVSIRHGREITVDPIPGVGSDVIAPWIQGASLSLVLHQRGYLVMHASAVEIDGHAAIFIGEVGWGKSTTAAAMHARGHRLLADDIVAIKLAPDGAPQVISGFPHLKLTDQAVRFIGEDPTVLNQVVDDPQKLLRVSPIPPPARPLPLAAVFVLGEGETCEVEPLGANRALPELMRHAFVATNTELLRLTETAGTHFKNCTAVIRHASIAHLRRPRSFERLGELATLAERHVRSHLPQEKSN